MRGVAALAVVTGHLHPRYAPSSHLPVDFFYALSGLVLAQAYGERLRSGLGMVAFMRLRIQRRYPLFLIGTLLGLVQILLLIEFRLKTVSGTDLLLSGIFNLLMLPSPSRVLGIEGAMQGLFPLNGPAWSLFWEMVVNILFAALLMRLTITHLIVVAAISFAALVWAAWHFGTLNIGWEWQSFIGGLPRVLFSFTVGMIIERRLGAAGGRAHPLAALLPLLLVLCFVVNVSGHVRIVYDLLFALLVSPAIVVAGVLTEVPGRLVKISAWLGYLSYPVYVLHRGPIGLYKALLGAHPVPASLACAAFLLLISLFATAVSRVVDRYVGSRNRKRRAVVEETLPATSL